MTAETPAKPLKVAIVGTAPTSRHLAPFGDDSWQIWACSGGNVDQLPRVNIWYELHAINEMMAPENRAASEPFFSWLRTKSEAGAFDVVMLEFNQLVPKAIPYPRDEMIGLFGRNWFTSSIAYMMAIAIARGATEIGLFGVDMAADQEHYEAQRAGCVRFIEIAHERGIQVHIPYESSLNAATPMYGYWEGTPFGRRINAVMQIVQSTRNQAVAEIERQTGIRNYFDGALEQLRYFRRTWTDGAELEVNLGNLPDLIAKAKAESLDPDAIDRALAAAEAPSVVMPSPGPLDSLVPVAANGAMHEPEHNLESMA